MPSRLFVIKLTCSPYFQKPHYSVYCNWINDLIIIVIIFRSICIYHKSAIDVFQHAANRYCVLKMGSDKPPIIKIPSIHRMEGIFHTVFTD